MGAYIEVYYCAAAHSPNNYGAGSARMYEAEVTLWLMERMGENRPVLITGIKVITGTIGTLTTVG